MKGRVVLAVLAGVLWFAAPAVASTFTVQNLDDSGQGSLRQTIINANNNGGPGETIDFASGLTGVLNLTSGPLAITNNMTIDGPGAGQIEVDGDGLQILTVLAPSTVSISGLRFAFGSVADNGGAIANHGTLTLSDDVFDHNHASGPGGGVGQGGAVYNAGGLTVTNSTFTDNTAGGPGGSGFGSGIGEGGAIFSDNPSTLIVGGSTFARNSVGGDGGSGQDSGEGSGGAIAINSNTSLTLSDSTLTQNMAGGADGGVFLNGLGEGGGIAVGPQATATLQRDTIDANVLGSAQGATGAGVFNQGTLSVVGTIVSGNAGAGNCNAPPTSASFSLEGPAGQTTCGFDLSSADPLLGPLADNGGPTQTQALGVGSPAIGAVTSGPDCLGTDQRGAGRFSAHCDVGAYEVAPPNWGAAAQVLNVGTTTATLLAFLNNPDVLAGTAMFQYGTSTAYGSSTPPVGLPAVHAPLDAIAFLSGLTSDTIYHYRAVASNPDGTVYGPDQQFTTASPAASTSPPPATTKPAPPPNTFAFGKAKVASDGRIMLPVHAPDAGRFVAKAMFTVRSKHRTITIVYGSARVTSTGAGTFELVIGLSARAAHELKLLGRRQLTITVTFTPIGGTPHRQTAHVTVRRSRNGRYA